MIQQLGREERESGKVEQWPGITGPSAKRDAPFGVQQLFIVDER